MKYSALCGIENYKQFHVTFSVMVIMEVMVLRVIIIMLVVLVFV